MIRTHSGKEMVEFITEDFLGPRQLVLIVIPRNLELSPLTPISAGRIYQLSIEQCYVVNE